MLRVVTLLAGLLTVVLAALALGLPWATADSPLGEGQWHLMSVHADTGGNVLRVAWMEDAFDDQDGIGGLRASGPMWISALALIGLAVLGTEHTLLGFRSLAWPAFGASAVGAVLTIVSVILMPLSIQANHEWDLEQGFSDPGSEITWHAGLYLGVATAVFAIGTAVVAALAARRAEA